MAQIHGKQLRATSVALAKLNNAGSQGTVLFGTGTALGMTDAPSAGTDLTNKTYVDSLASGLDPKESVRVATTAGLILNTMIADNSTPATTQRSYNTTNKTMVFFAAQGPTAIDGVTLANGDRILHKIDDATSGPSGGEGRIYNGIYVRTSPDLWTRAADQDGTPANEVSGGNYTFVEQGTAEANIGYVLQGDGILTLQTDNLNWVQFSSTSALSAGNGIDITTGTVSVDLLTNGGLTFSTAQLTVDSSDGITLDANGVKVNLTTNGGLGFTGSAGAGTLNILKDSTTANTIGVATTANGAGIVYNNAAGLTETTETLAVNLVAAGGLEFSGTSGIQINGDATTANTIAIATTANGAGIVYDPNSGLTETTDTLKVNLSGTGGLGFTTGAIQIVKDVTTGATVAGITVGANGAGVAVDNTTITHSAGTLSVSVSGLALTASDISDFNEAAQDAIGLMVSNTTTINLTYTDGTPDLSAVVNSNSIDENMLTASVAGTGLSGGNGSALSVNYSTAGASGAAIEAVSLAAQTSGLGASMVGIWDTAANFTATNVEDALAELYTAIVNGGVPVTDNKEMTASVTTADFDLATATTIVGTPASDSYVQVFVNGVKMVVGDGVKTKDCYFATDGTGTVAINIANIVATDQLYWVGSVAGFELDGNDRIDFDYAV